MRAVQITRFGGLEVLEVVDVPEPVPGDGQQLYDVSTAGVNYADTHHDLSSEVPHLLQQPSAGNGGNPASNHVQGSLRELTAIGVCGWSHLSLPALGRVERTP